MAEHGPTARTKASAGARPTHQENPCIRRPCGSDYEGLGSGFDTNALETIGWPCSPILYEHPNQAG